MHFDCVERVVSRRDVTSKVESGLYRAAALQAEHVQSLHLIPGTRYRIVSVIQHRVSASFRANYLKRGIIFELVNTLSAVEMLHVSAL